MYHFVFLKKSIQVILVQTATKRWNDTQQAPDILLSFWENENLHSFQKLNEEIIYDQFINAMDIIWHGTIS